MTQNVTTQNAPTQNATIPDSGNLDRSSSTFTTTKARSRSMSASPSLSASTPISESNVQLAKPLIELIKVTKIFGQVDVKRSNIKTISVKSKESDSAKHMHGDLSQDNSSLCVLKDIDLTIRANEITMLFSPSGSGKSSLLNILGKLDTQFTGRMREDDLILGKDLTFIYQQHYLLSDLSVRENITLPLRLHHLPIIDTEINKLLEMFNLPSLQSARTLSVGQAQRVAVLRAIVTKPKIIIADEPTGSLDPQNARLVMDVLMNLRQEYGSSLVMATHNEQLLKYADRVFCFKDKQLVMLRN